MATHIYTLLVSPAAAAFAEVYTDAEKAKDAARRVRARAIIDHTVKDGREVKVSIPV